MAIGDGRKTKGITKQAIERICGMADFIDKHKFNTEIRITVRESWELTRCRDNWAGFTEIPGGLKYKCVTVVMG